MALTAILPHMVVRPSGPDATDAIRRFEARTTFRLAADLAEVYGRFHDADFGYGQYHLLPLDQVLPLGEAQLGDPTEDECPRSWLAFVDVFDGNYLAADLAAPTGYRWLDCDHESVGTPSVIAHSLAELIERASQSPHGLFFLQPGFVPYERLVYENPPSYHRRVDAAWWGSLGEEIGPERCKSASCERRRISLSVMCRRHHYEMMRGVGCPFDG